MTYLPDLVRDELAEVAGSSGLSPGFGDRVLAGARRRRRRRLVATGVAVLTMAGATLSAALASPLAGPSPTSANAANAIFAHRGFTEDDIGHWWVLDPTTGDYRKIHVATITAPTTTLRYAAVTRPWTRQFGPGVSPEKKIGRYDALTGEINWYDVPVVLGTAPRISPDGRYAVAVAATGSTRPRDFLRTLVLLDLDTGRTRLVNVDPADAAAVEMPTTISGVHDVIHPGDGLSWHPDSRHLLVGNIIIDLDGQRTGTLPIPDDSQMVSVRPDASGMLVKLASHDPTSDVYALTDAAGKVTGPVTLSGCAGAAGAGPFPSGTGVPPQTAHPSGTGVPPQTADPSGTGVPPQTADPSASPLPPAAPTEVPGSPTPQPPTPQPPTPQPAPEHVWCSSSLNEFLGWRGGTVILVADDRATTLRINAVDISTGRRWAVHHPAPQLRPLPPPYLLIVPAEQLTDEARRRVGF
ncbi:MAG TPA: hypothetical protein VFM55_10920 [Micromonosporaceae bacterium]|nr:hypothetical protein [Micromonosporaceae bacterium]